MREEFLDEKILSAIVEIKTDIDQVENILDLVDQVNQRIDTVTALGISTRCDEGEDLQLAEKLDQLGYARPRAKTNMGLGRKTNQPIPLNDPGI